MIVSVAMITYGHEHLIEEAIDSVLMQEVDFDVELIIADDCSPDNTEAMVRRIANEHPNGHWIKYTKHQKNKGIAENFAWSLLAGEGEFIAICEGDDYWTDSKKLQKQVDFLKSNESYSMVCHATEEVDAEGNLLKKANRGIDKVDLAMVLKEGWFLRTASMVFRRKVLDEGFPDFFYKAYSTDYILQVMILKQGASKYLSDVMSAYRHHQGGVSDTDAANQVKRWVKKIRLLNQLDDFTNNLYKKKINIQQDSIKRNISLFCLKYPSIVHKIGFTTYRKHIFSIHLIHVLIYKLGLKLK